MPRSTRKNRKLSKSRAPIKKKLTKKKQCGGLGWIKRKAPNYDDCGPFRLENSLRYQFSQDEGNVIDSIVKELKNSPTYLAKTFEDYMNSKHKHKPTAFTNVPDSIPLIAYVEIHYNKNGGNPYIKLEFYSQKDSSMSHGATGEQTTFYNCKPFHIKPPIDDSKPPKSNINQQNLSINQNSS